MAGVRRGGLAESGKMAITKERKAELISQFRRDEADSGSPEVQIALLTARINESDRAHADAQEGLLQPARAPQARQPAVGLAEVPPGNRSRPLPGGHRQARAPEVTHPSRVVRSNCRNGHRHQRSNRRSSDVTTC